MTRRVIPLVPALALTLALPACSLEPKLPEAAPAVPASWPEGAAYSAQGDAELPTVSYRDIFRDPRLQALVEQALMNNRDLRIAAANLTEARAQVRIASADQVPQIDANGSATRSDTGTTPASRSYTADASISSFELDLFGKLANATKAERERMLSTEAAARTVRLGLVADLADAWSSYAADNDLLKIAQTTADSARESVKLTKARLKAGVAPRSDVRQAEQVLATAEGDVASQTAALAQDENLIRLLIGAEFDPALLPGAMPEVTASTETLPAGTSSKVLLRRPDVEEAEYLLRAANADIGVARAELFPSISLTGLLGYASGALSDLFTKGAYQKAASANASYAIFAGGGVRANIDASKAQRDAALATYEKAIQTAFREVSDALADQGTIAERLRTAQANRAAAEDTAKLTEARYRGGVDSYLANLDAQRSLYSARQAEVLVELQRVNNRVTLYRVLGGDQIATAGPAASQGLR